MCPILSHSVPYGRLSGPGLCRPKGYGSAGAAGLGRGWASVNQRAVLVRTQAALCCCGKDSYRKFCRKRECIIVLWIEDFLAENWG